MPLMMASIGMLLCSSCHSMHSPLPAAVRPCDSEPLRTTVIEKFSQRNAAEAFINRFSYNNLRSYRSAGAHLPFPVAEEHR